ncbi:hypothetical protein PoB_001523800 [Plakobranchus ocellatus]|uniref:Uncharacterized protein n=1 Tax=Plakobranchus ocellatus TaxID=259542 RepID=A0AAV3Z2L3_9GAST|nr:hypothetical protein PoB_001523800 [Plakobranchus ocellatus]
MVCLLCRGGAVAHLVGQSATKSKVRGSNPSPAKARPQQGDLRLSSPPPGQGGGDEGQTCDRGVPADPKADSLSNVLPTSSALEQSL